MQQVLYIRTMSVRMRHTRSHTGNRRAHHALSGVQFSRCRKCSAPVLPHHVCANCGAYRGREVVDVFKKLTKKERKEKEKKLQEEERQSTTAPLSAEELSRK